MCLEASLFFICLVSSAPNPSARLSIFVFLQRTRLTFMPCLSVFATSSDVGHCKDTTHVSHEDEPGHTKQMVKGLTATKCLARITLAPSTHTGVPLKTSLHTWYHFEPGAQCLHSSLKSSSVKLLTDYCKAQTFSRAFSIPHFEQLSWQTEHCQATWPSPGVNTQYSAPATPFFPVSFSKLSWKKRKKALSEVWLCTGFSEIYMLN